MDVTKIKRMIGQCSNIDELREVSKAAKYRIDRLTKQAHAQKVADMLAWMKTLKQGDTIYCNMKARRLWDGYQGGDALEVHHWQPRKKILWVKFKDKLYWMTPEAAVKNKIGPELTEKPVTDEARKTYKVMGDMFEEISK